MNLTNWENSFDKWKEIVSRTKLKRDWPFPSGWTGLNVLSECGYCTDVKGETWTVAKYCDDCILYQKNICYKNIAMKEHFTFWLYVENMRTIVPNWLAAIEQSETVLNAIIDHGRELGFYKGES